jgi:flagellar hook assembly protein FlgD
MTWPPIVGISDVVGAPLPVRFELGRCLPNPSSGRMTVHYALPRASTVLAQVFNASGELVRTIAQGTRPAGYLSVNWDGRDAVGRPVNSGVYYCRFRADSFHDARKLVVQR